MTRDKKLEKMQNEVYMALKVDFNAMDQKIKEKQDYRKLLDFKAELYNKCLDDHLLEKGSKIVRVHLDEVHEEMHEVDKEIEEMIVLKDAYRIELEEFEDQYREKLQPVKMDGDEEETPDE